ncbi:MAG TPA: hypothetical protein VFI31_19795 [Pirellulales bacterium]|nr:hypothetical protein [Pirellulales bacterium]
MSRRSSASDFGLATLLAAGLHLVILVMGIFIDKPLERFFDPPSPGLLRVHRSGNVVLEQPMGGFRSLSGRPLDDAEISKWLSKDGAEEGWLSPAALLSASDQRTRQARGIWYYRLVELQGDPQISWFIVQPQIRSGLAYCVGYDKATKELFGYMGQKGFHRALPPPEEWFPATGDLNMRLVSGASIGRTAAGARVPVVTRPSARGVVFLASNDRIWAIDLAARTVGVLFESPDITSLRASPDEKPELLVRTSSEIIAIDLQGSPRTKWKVPEVLQRDSLQWYELADGGALTQELRQTANKVYLGFIWMDRNGTITHSEQFETRLGLPVGPRMIHLLVAAATPSPLTFSFVSMIAVPLTAVGQGEQPDLPTAIAHTLADAWPALATLNLVSAVLAWLAYRRQVRYALSGAGAWAVFVFLLGVPGWLAYRWHRRWPLVDSCGECHRPAPRDREACAACGQLFAPPPLLGTEIFA